MLIAGDVGGTKTLLALYDPKAGARAPVAQQSYHSADFPGLSDMVRLFLDEAGRRATAACFDVAGPVVDGRAQLTNLPWVVTEDALAGELGLRHAVLLNDLAASALAVPHLLPDEMLPLRAGTPQPKGPIAVVAPGTGLGEAFLVWGGHGYVACASEGGHADFAPADDVQAALLAHVRARYGHVAWERVCSGSGLPNVYDFVRDQGGAADPAEFTATLAQAADRTPAIVEAALADPAGHPQARATLDLFVAILGAEAGNLALKVLPTGGVFLAGGMPPRIATLLTDGRFLAAFAAKGRMQGLLERLPVTVVTTPRSALLGAAVHGLALLER